MKIGGNIMTHKGLTGKFIPLPCRQNRPSRLYLTNKSHRRQTARLGFSTTRFRRVADREIIAQSYRLRKLRWAVFVSIASIRNISRGIGGMVVGIQS